MLRGVWSKELACWRCFSNAASLLALGDTGQFLPEGKGSCSAMQRHCWANVLDYKHMSIGLFSLQAGLIVQFASKFGLIQILNV